MWPKWIGHSLGRYRIEELLGRGAMGVVLRAVDPELQRTVAIKILYPNLTADTDLVERFRLEARTAANLHHRNIVAIHDVGYAEDLYYIVMEYLDGPSLDKIVTETGPLPVERVLGVCEQVASALDYIHRRKLLHRDVKSTNIMIDPEGRAVLTDFGLVMTSKGSTVTSEGKILGTPQYMAPEQIAGGELGVWTDLYSLGVVVYQMLTGELPFNADAPAALLFQVMWQPPPSVSNLRPELPAAVDGVFQRVLAKEPNERYPNGTAFVAALQQALNGESAQVVELPQPVRKRAIALPSPRSWPSWLWAALGALVLLLATGPLLVLGTGLFYSPPPPTATMPVAALIGTSSPTPLPPPTATPVPPTSAPSVLLLPSATPVTPRPTLTPVRPTLTPTPVPVVPTVRPTVKPVRPTRTPVPPTVPPTPVPPTPVPPTDTPVPPPPDTPVPPSPTTPIPPPTTPETPPPPPTAIPPTPIPPPPPPVP